MLLQKSWACHYALTDLCKIL